MERFVVSASASRRLRERASRRWKYLRRECGKLQQEVPVDTTDAIISGLSFAVVGFFVVRGGLRYRKNPTRYTDVSTSVWQEYALERQWTYQGGPDKGSFQGEIEGQSLSADVRVRRYRTRRGEVVEARSSFRVPIRGLVPVLSIQPKSFRSQFLLLVSGGRPFATDVLKLDEQFVISGEDVDAVVPLVRKPAVRQALEMLARVCPEAVVHERAVELNVDGMESSHRNLDRVLQAMTAVAAAIELSCPRLDGSLPVIPERTPPDPERGIVPSATPLPDPAALHRPDPLYLALQRVGRQAPTQQALTIQYLRLPPYTFALEVRSITEAESFFGTKRGDLQINGILTRADWRMELVVPADQANTVLTLVIGDVIEGECLLEDIRAARKTIEAKTDKPIEIVSRAAPLPDALR